MDPLGMMANAAEWLEPLDMMANSPELSPSSSLSPQSAANRAEAEREGKRLTEEQKKVNHLTSEKKRRDNIRSGFDGLAGIVPGMEGRARSEGVVLFGAIDYVRRLMLERRAMIETLEGNGVTVDAELKLSLQMLPQGFLDDDKWADKFDKDGQSQTEGGSEPPEGTHGTADGMLEPPEGMRAPGSSSQQWTNGQKAVPDF